MIHYPKTLLGICIGTAAILASDDVYADIAQIDFEALPVGAYLSGDTVAANSFTTISTDGVFSIGPSGFSDGDGRITILGLGAGAVIFTFDTAAVTVNSVTFTGRSNNAIVFVTAFDPNGLKLGTESTDPSWSLPVESSFFGQAIGSVDVVMFESEIRSMTIDFDSALVDSDGDSIADNIDNCVLMENPMQEDADGDNYGNLCDTDLNNDCAVNFQDLGDLRTVFFTDDAVADFNSDGAVNFVDLGVMRDQFFGLPGPSGLTDICEP